MQCFNDLLPFSFLLFIIQFDLCGKLNQVPVSFYPRDAMLAHTCYCPLSVCHISVFYRNGCTDRARFRHRGYLRLILHCNVVRVSPTSGYFPLELCPRLNFNLSASLATARRNSASVVKLVWPTTVASLSHWASAVVYNKMAVTHSVARVRLRHLRLVSIHVYRMKAGQSPSADTCPLHDLVCYQVIASADGCFVSRWYIWCWCKNSRLDVPWLVFYRAATWP